MNDIHIPVCHVDLMEGVEAGNPGILDKHALINYSTMVDALPVWLEALGRDNLQSASTLWFEQLYSALKAATEGLGIVISPLMLVLDDIIAGRMVAPFGLMDAKRRPYYVCVLKTPSTDPVVKCFADWLRQEGRDSERSAQAWVESMGWASGAFTSPA